MSPFVSIGCALTASHANRLTTSPILFVLGEDGEARLLGATVSTEHATMLPTGGQNHQIDAQIRWRAVNAPHLVALVRAGAHFERGQLVERPEAVVA
jgi:hypothetical protein